MEMPEPTAPRRRRRWVLFALPVVLLVGLVAVPVAVFVMAATLRASEGAGSPLAAVVGAMGGLDRWGADDELVGVGRYISSEHFDEVRGRLIELRHQLVNRGYAAVMEIGPAQERRTADDRATVIVEYRVSATLPGQTLSADSEYHPWTFQTVLASRFHGGGWKVDAIDAPDICGTYLRCTGP